VEAAAGVTWLLQMGREMSIEAQQWEFFTITWKAMGFPFDNGLRRRISAHGRMLDFFLSDAKSNLVPRAGRIGIAELGEWSTRLGKLQKTHGQLIPLFRRESERFAAGRGGARDDD